MIELITTYWSVAAIIAVLAIGWWLVPIWQIRRIASRIPDQKDRAELEDSFRKTIGQTIAGFAVFVSLALTFQQIRSTQENSDRVLASTQLSKGYELLESEQLVVRLGGIYVLESVAQASPEYHWSIMEALSAHLRATEMNSHIIDPATAQKMFKPLSFEEEQAIITMLARRKSDLPEYGALDLSFLDFEGVDFGRGDFSGACFFSTRLGDSSLVGANLMGTNFLAARFSSTLLTNADLSHAVIGADFLNSNLANAKLVGADLSSTKMHGVDLTGADLAGARLDDVDLSGAIGLTQEQLDTACGTPKALPSPSLTVKPCESTPRRSWDQCLKLPE